jgi:hypothetical protein
MKLHKALFVISGIGLFKMFSYNGPGQAGAWFLCGAIAFFGFLAACIAKSVHDDKLEGATYTRDAAILLILWKLFKH